MSSEDSSVIGSLIGLIVLIILSCRGCVVDDRKPVEAVMKTQGFTEFTINDKDWLFVGLRGCQADEAAKFEVTATNPMGEKVNFLVCTGWPFKGATIRTEW